MPDELNPYTPPATVESKAFPWLAQRFPGRSIIAFVFAALVAFTALLTGGLWTINAIDLGRFGGVFLLSLVLSSALLIYAASSYANGSRGFAVLLIVLSLGAMICGILPSLRDAGMIPTF